MANYNTQGILRANQPAPSGELFGSKPRTALEQILYGLSKEHARQAFEAQDANEELGHALQSIILAAACLESFINFMWNESEHPSRKDMLKPLDRKWEEVTKKKSEGMPMDKDAPSFQGLTKLKDDRNYILHYKTYFEPADGGLAEARERINAASAKESVRVMRAILVEFHERCNLAVPDWIT